MSKFSLSITSNNLPIITLFEILLTLTIRTHHIKVKSEHCNMNPSWHLIYCWDVSVDDFILIFPWEVVVHVGYLSYSLLDYADSAFIEEVVIMRDLWSFVNNFAEFSQLICSKEKLTHPFDLKCGFSPLILKSFFYSCHDVILIWYNKLVNFS